MAKDPQRPVAEHTCIPHIPEELWRAYLERRIALANFAELVIEHLCKECPVCAAARAAAQQSSGSSDYAAVFARLEARQSELVQQVETERVTASAELEELLALPVSERLGRIERARTRFRSPVLAELLLDHSFAALPHDPETSLHFAVLADAIVTLNPCRGSASAKVRALAHKGNALRARGRLSEALHSLALARTLLQNGVPVAGDRPEIPVSSSLYALLDRFQGLYYKAITDFPAAEECLNRAALLYAAADDRNALHRVSLTLADVYAQTDNYEDALEGIARVLTHLSEEEDAPLYWLARFNHAVYLTESQLFDEARAEIAACAASSVFGEDEFYQRRLQWIDGRIALGQDDFSHAARALSSVRRAYLEEGSGINMALVSLDLGVVYLKQGKTREVKSLAEELALIFDDQDVHREATAAMLLFQEAARQEAVTLHQLLRLRRYLEAARNNPELVFEQPS